MQNNSDSHIKNDMIYAAFRCLFLECNDTFLDTMTGLVQSPLYPNYYQNSMRCDILIKAPVNYTLMLQFPYLNMATGDSLQVGLTTNYNKLQKSKKHSYIKVSFTLSH